MPDPIINIVIPVSKNAYVVGLFEMLEDLECDVETTNLLTYVDGGLELFQKVRNLTNKSKFKQRLCVYRKKGNPSVSSIFRRRKRIGDIHKEIKQYLGDCDYVFLVEDDTRFDSDTLEKLLSNYRLVQKFGEVDNAGFVSGVQLGRWGFAHIGAWEVDNVEDPASISSVSKGEGIREVDAAGLYCCLVSRSNYLNGTFEPFGKILGPDFTFGLSLRRKGLVHIIDFDIKCDHLTKKEPVTFDNTEIIKIRFDKTDNARFGWELKQL